MHQYKKDIGNKTNLTELQVFFSAHQKSYLKPMHPPLKQNKKKIKGTAFWFHKHEKKKLEGLSPKFSRKNLHYYTSEPVKVKIHIHKKVRRNKRELQTNKKPEMKVMNLCTNGSFQMPQKKRGMNSTKPHIKSNVLGNKQINYEFTTDGNNGKKKNTK